MDQSRRTPLRGQCDVSDRDLARLIDLAIGQGVTAAASIDASEVVVREELAAMCAEPRCESYGLSAGCPPHVAGPGGMRELLASVPRAIVFKLDVPTAVLLSDERREVFRLLHESAAAIERAAVAMGYGASRAFVGGSCKVLFCDDEASCAVISGAGDCRHPDRARPSMSGQGVDVQRLMASAGWEMRKVTAATKAVEGDTSPIVGLVLIG